MLDDLLPSHWFGCYPAASVRYRDWRGIDAVRDGPIAAYYPRLNDAARWVRIRLRWPANTALGITPETAAR